MDVQTVSPPSAVSQLSEVLDSAEIRALIAEIEALRWTGRPGYGVRAMVGMVLAKGIYAMPMWSRIARLVAEHPGLQAVLGCTPSQWSCYRFCRLLREHSEVLANTLDAVLDLLREHLPEMGQNVAVDGSDLPAYANGQRLKSKNGPERKPEEYSDPDASWGHRSAVSTRKGGGYYGYKVHAAVCTVTDLPLAWRTETAKDSEQTFALALIDATRERGFSVEIAVMDKGYDSEAIHDGCMDRGILPVTSLRETPAVKRGEHKPPCCEHGEWIFAGADFKRKATKWRCPTGECQPASVWVKASRCIRSSRASPSAAASSTAAVAQSSGSSAGSRMSGRCCRSVSVVSTA